MSPSLCQPNGSEILWGYPSNWLSLLAWTNYATVRFWDMQFFETKQVGEQPSKMCLFFLLSFWQNFSIIFWRPRGQKDVRKGRRLHLVVCSVCINCAALAIWVCVKTLVLWRTSRKIIRDHSNLQSGMIICSILGITLYWPIATIKSEDFESWKTMVNSTYPQSKGLQVLVETDGS